jgi:hypothetical protein
VILLLENTTNCQTTCYGRDIVGDEAVSSSPAKIVYRGVSMIEGWPEKIREAQKITTCLINGRETTRVRYGGEQDDWGADTRACHDCAVIKGEFHVEGCDVERCAGCGGQRFGCDCEPADEEA